MAKFEIVNLKHMKTITNFWNHFQKNNFIFLFILEITHEEVQINFNKVTSLLHDYDKNLDIIIKTKENKGELIITANGNKEAYENAFEIVRHAPKIERWKITALLKPTLNIEKYESGNDNPFRFFGMELKISEMYFTPIKWNHKKRKITIIIWIKNYLAYKNIPELKQSIYIIIEHLLGEDLAINNIQKFKIKQLKTNSNQLIELYHLKDYITYIQDE